MTSERAGNERTRRQRMEGGAFEFYADWLYVAEMVVFRWLIVSGNGNVASSRGQRSFWGLSMRKKDDDVVKVVTGPLGEPMTRADLPPPDTARWVMRRKAQIVSAIHGGLISESEACSIYNISPDELLAWKVLVEKCGMLGLRATKLQHYKRLIDRKIR